MNLMSWSRLLCSWQDVSICLARLPCLSQTTLMDPTWFLMEEGGKGLCQHWGCILCTPENPGDKIWWKGSDCCWGNHAVISHGESWVGAYLIATWCMEGRNMQLCGSLGQLKCIKRIADDSSYIFLADKLVPDCWLSVRRQSLVWVSILNLSCFLSKFSSVCQVRILKEHMQSCPEEK